MESYMVGTKITRSVDRMDGKKNNSPKGWTYGELDGWHKNNLPKDEELNGQLKNI